LNSLTNQEVQHIRADFPILQMQIRGKPLVYLDNGATTQKPIQVIESQARVYRELNANVHRGVHYLSQISTDAYEKSRKKIAHHLGVKDDAEIIFVRGTTEAINVVATSWGNQFVKEGDEIIVSRMEHHSNFVPWQSLAMRKGANFRIWEMEQDLTLSMETLESMLKTGKVKVVAFTAMGNVLGTITPVKEFVKMAHKYGAIAVVDAAQALGHLPGKMVDWNADFVAFSAHKMCGPTGIGVLWGRRSLLEEMPPYQFGGDMILQVGDEVTTWNELPWKFEAGTPNYGDSIAFGTALDYLARIGMEKIHGYETELVAMAREGLQSLPGITLYTSPVPVHGALISFTTKTVHPHDMATFLDAEGVAVRAGHHCAQPLMRKLGLAATTRASFSFYNTKDEVEFFLRSVKRALEYFS